MISKEAKTEKIVFLSIFIIFSFNNFVRSISQIKEFKKKKLVIY